MAACEFIDKVQYINYIKDLPSEISRNAAIALYFHKNGIYFFYKLSYKYNYNKINLIFIEEALQILLSAKLYYRAIKLYIKLYRWEKALDLALQTKTHVATVVGYRQRYLQKIKKEEWLTKFQKISSEVITYFIKG